MENENNKPDNNTNNNATNFPLANNLVDAMLQRQCEHLLEKTLEDSMKDCISNMAVQIQSIVAVANFFIENHLNVANTSNNTTDLTIVNSDVAYKERGASTTDCTLVTNDDVRKFKSSDYITREDNTTTIIGEHHEVDSSGNESI